MNENVLVEVRSNYFLPNFTCLVIGHWGAIYSENVIVESKIYAFNFNATFDLAPKATVIVYYFKGDGIVSKKADVIIDNNYVKLKLSTAETQPGENVTIDVVTSPGSHVGLLGVDQSVLLLKSGDGLTSEDIVEEMDQHQNNYFNAGIGPWSVDWHQYYYDYSEAFLQSKMMFFTNAKRQQTKNADIGFESDSYEYDEEPMYISTRFQGLPGPQNR